MTAIWLFLYLACLVRVVSLYTLDAKSPTTMALLLPILLLPLTNHLRRRVPSAFQGQGKRMIQTCKSPKNDPQEPEYE